MKKKIIIHTSTKFINRFILNKLGFYKPFFAQWEITYRCNLKCVFCNVYKDRTYDKTELDTLGAFKLLDELKKAGIIALNFTGGEPLLRKDIHKILEHAKKKNKFMVTMNCNSILIGKKIDLIKNYIDRIHISFDSHNKEKFEKLRGVKDIYDKVINGIKIAKENGVYVAANMIVTKENINDMEKVCFLIKDIGIDLFFFPVFIISTEFKDKSLSSKIMVDRIEYYKRVKKLKKKYSFVKTSDVYLDFVKKGGFNNYKCMAMRYMLNIKPDGSIVLPCGYFPYHKFKGKISDIIKSYDFQKETKIKRYKFCKNCTLSCFFIPTALMDPTKIMSFIKSYIL